MTEQIKKSEMGFYYFYHEELKFFGSAFFSRIESVNCRIVSDNFKQIVVFNEKIYRIKNKYIKTSKKELIRQLFNEGKLIQREKKECIFLEKEEDFLLLFSKPFFKDCFIYYFQRNNFQKIVFSKMNENKTNPRWFSQTALIVITNYGEIYLDFELRENVSTDDGQVVYQSAKDYVYEKTKEINKSKQLPWKIKERGEKDELNTTTRARIANK